MERNELERRKLLDRWRRIQVELDDDDPSPLKHQQTRRAKEQWFSDSFQFLVDLPADDHIWCGFSDIMGPLLETFHSYFSDTRVDSPLKLIWKRVSQEMGQCAQCICQHHQAQESYNAEYESDTIDPLLRVLHCLDEERVTDLLKEVNARLKRREYDPECQSAEVVSVMFEYRMHPEICRFPSLHFYENKLLNGAQMVSKSALFHENACLGPYMFFDIIDGHEHDVKSSASLSLYNESEVEAAIRILKFVNSRFSLEFVSRRIGIITPYRSQLSLLRSRYSSAFGSTMVSEMEFNTVDGFQGREVDILVLSTVRASDSTNSSSIGFVADVRRMNVALTRAKFSLWIVGNARTLQRNLHWAALIKNSKERNLFISVSRPYTSIFENPLSSSTENPSSKSYSYSSRHPKLAEKVRCASPGVHDIGANSKEVPGGETDLVDGKLHQHLKGSQNSPKDDSPYNELALKRTKDRESAMRRHPLSSFEFEGNKFQRQKNHSANAVNALQKSLMCSSGDEIVQNVQLETDFSTKELIKKAKDTQRSCRHDIYSKSTQQNSLMALSAKECHSLCNEAPIKKAKEARKSSEHVTSSKLSRQSSTVAPSAEGSHSVKSDKALIKKAKEGRRSLEYDTSSKLSLASSAEGSHRLSDKVLMKKTKEGSDSCAEGSHRMRERSDCKPPNLEDAPGILKVKAKGSRRFSEHGTSSRLSQSSSTLSSTVESKILETSDGRPSNVGDAPKSLMATRKRQRDDVEALLSSALISPKKSESSSKPGSVKRL